MQYTISLDASEKFVAYLKSRPYWTIKDPQYPDEDAVTLKLVPGKGGQFTFRSPLASTFLQPYVREVLAQVSTATGEKMFTFLFTKEIGRGTIGNGVPKVTQ